jgi:hypothetical protein
MPFETPKILADLFDVVNVSPRAVVHETEGPNPTTIIRTDQDWYVDVEWDTVGPLTGLIGGTWHLHVYLESMGPGKEYELFDKNAPPHEHDIPLTPGAAPVHYHLHPDIDPKIVEPGAYKLVVTVTYTDLANTPFPMAGYWEGPIVQFIEP